MRSLTLFLVLSLIVSTLYAQPNPNKHERELLNLINQARTNPSKFLDDYKDELKSTPNFIKLLKSSQAMNALELHEGLCNGAEKKLKGDLNPSYEGNFCSTSACKQLGWNNTQIEILNLYATNMLDPEYTHIGIAYKVDGLKFSLSFYWARDCSTAAIKKKYVFNGKVDSSSVNFNRINTAKNANYMTAGEKQMVQEINFVRYYPKVYADIIKEEMSKKSESWSGLSHDDMVAFEELISELESREALSILKPKQCIYSAARVHAKDQTKRGFTGHTGTDRSNPWDRIKKQCPDMIRGNENLAGGGKGTARSAVIQLLIDSGIPGRGHRYNMLNPEWTHVACYYNGKVGTMPDNWIQNFAKF